MARTLASLPAGRRILGQITDQTGGAVVGATVAVTDVQRGMSRNLTIDQAGEYVAVRGQPVRASRAAISSIRDALLGMRFLPSVDHA